MAPSPAFSSVTAPPFLPLALLHPVADAPLVEDVGGVGRVVTQFAAQPLHDGAHRPRASCRVPAPDPSKQLLMGHDPSGVGRKLSQHPVLDVCQLDRSAGDGRPTLSIVDAQAAEEIGFAGRVQGRHGLSAAGRPGFSPRARSARRA